MTDDAHRTSDQPRGELPATCPSCGARVRTGVSWCTQCYEPLTGPTATKTDPIEEPIGASSESTHESTPESTLEPSADPGRAPDANAEEVERLAQQMLSQLAAERDGLPGLMSRLPATPAARAVLVTVLVVVGAALVLLAMFAAGSLF